MHNWNVCNWNHAKKDGMGALQFGHPMAKHKMAPMHITHKCRCHGFIIGFHKNRYSKMKLTLTVGQIKQTWLYCFWAAATDKVLYKSFQTGNTTQDPPNSHLKLNSPHSYVILTTLPEALWATVILKHAINLWQRIYQSIDLGAISTWH